MKPNKFNETLNNIKENVELLSNSSFNCVLLNLYRNGQDSNGWHSDNEKELGENPTIASVSFGYERYFNMKHRENKSFKLKLLLTSSTGKQTWELCAKVRVKAPEGCKKVIDRRANGGHRRRQIPVVVQALCCMPAAAKV